MTPPVETYLREGATWRSLLTGRVLVDRADITHGRDITGPKVGLAGVGVDPASFTLKDYTVYDTPGEVIEHKRFIGGVQVTAPNVTIRECLFESSGENLINLNVTPDAVNFLMQDSDISPVAGTSCYVGVLFSGVDGTLSRVNVERCENNLTFAGNGLHVLECYLHDVDDISTGGEGHRDTVEVYSGTDLIIERSKLVMDAGETAVLNIAPFGGDDVFASDIYLLDCYVDGGIEHVLVDYQGVTGDVYNVRVLRNDFGGHTFPGYASYWALNNHDDNDDDYLPGTRPVVETLAEQEATPRAILWPTSGPDANYWVDCDDLEPDLTGQIAYPDRPGGV